MQTFKHVSGTIISILLGLIFLYSGYSKLLPIVETFEFTFVDLHIANWYTAPVIARLVIGIEIVIGILLLLNFRLKKLTIPATAGMLIFFTLYLIALIIVSGNTGNCGCFGEHLRMTPLEAIIKNVFMLLGCWWVYRSGAGWTHPLGGILIALVVASGITLPFILNPVDYTYSSNNLQEKVNYELEIDLLYHPVDSGLVETPKVELRKGKHVLAFLSLSCSHCRIAAKKFRIIKKNNPSLPIYFVLNGDEVKYKAFIEDTRADNIPSSYCLGKTFIKLASAQLPRIYYIDNKIVVKKVDYFELNQYNIEQWVGR